MTLLLPYRRPLLAPPFCRNELWRRARAVPSLDLRFADSKSLRDAVSGQNLITFTRASGGTYVDSQGVIRNATTNLLLFSEQFDNAQWIKRGTCAVVANDAIAPNGTLTADKITFAGSTNDIYYSGLNVAAALATSPSIYIKKITATGTFKLACANSSSNGDWTVDLSKLSTGWERLTASHPAITVITPFTGSGNAFSGLQIYTHAGATVEAHFWGAQLEQSSTVGEYIPTGATINSAPRFDHNPTTGESLGLLVEQQRTNSIRNNTMVGAVAGTPGTLPTNWAIGGSGIGTLTQQVVGTGTVGSLSYVDIRFSGTTSTTNFRINFEPNTQTAAASGQSWTASAYTAVVAGSMSNVTSVVLGVTERTILGAFLDESISSVNTSAILSRGTQSRTFNQATTAFCNSFIAFNFASGVAIDITLRIGMPQLEQGATVSSVIPTTGTAATRSASLADLISAAIANNIRSFYVEFSSPAVGTRGAVSLNDNTANERLAVITSGTDPRLVVHDGGVEQANIDGGTVTADARTRVAVRIGTNDFAISVNGGAVVTDTSGTLPTVDRLMLGRTQAGEYLNGRLARFVGWSQLLPDSTLQTLGR